MVCDTVTGKSLAHFLSNCLWPPWGAILARSKIGPPLPGGPQNRIERKCARLLPVTVECVLSPGPAPLIIVRSNFGTSINSSDVIRYFWVVKFPEVSLSVYLLSTPGWEINERVYFVYFHKINSAESSLFMTCLIDYIRPHHAIDSILIKVNE